MDPEKFTLAVEIAVLVASGGQKQVFPFFYGKFPLAVCDIKSAFYYDHQFVVGEQTGQVRPVGIRRAKVAGHMEQQGGTAVNAMDFHGAFSSVTGSQKV